MEFGLDLGHVPDKSYPPFPCPEIDRRQPITALGSSICWTKVFQHCCIKVCVREWWVLIVTDHLEERETHSVHVSLNVHGKILIICTMKSNDCLCCFHGNVLVCNKYEIKTIVIVVFLLSSSIEQWGIRKWK